MSKYDFMHATANDLPEIIDLYHSLIGTSGCTWHLGYPNKEIAEADIRSRSLYILRDENHDLISVASAGTSDELEELQWNAKNPCDLARIGVLPTRQNQGIGSLMLSKVITDVKTRGFDGIRMLVSKNNPPALALYDKSGFVRRDEINMYDIDFFCYEMVF